MAADDFKVDYSLYQPGLKLGSGSSLGGLNTSNWTSGPSFTGASDPTQQFSNSLAKAGPYLAIAGAVGQMFGAYYSLKSQQYQLESQSSSLEFQKDISQINARQAEFQAQKTLEAGQRQAGAVSMKYGKIKGSQRAAMAAAGGVIGEGSYQAVEATTDLMKEIDVLTINANTVRAAENARTQSTNYKIQATMLGVSSKNAMTSSQSIDPFVGAGTSLLGSATSIATTLYRDKVIDRLLARQTY
jgi:hypothetical protein